MTYYYLNDQGLMQKQVGGVPPSNTFVAVSPDGTMRKFDYGQLSSVIPNANVNDMTKDAIEWSNANILLNGALPASTRRKKKMKSKIRRKCSCR